MGTTFGLDVDVGRVLGTARLDEGQVPTGGAVALHVRWLHAGRRSSGWSGYVLGGPRVMAAKNIDEQGHVTNRDPIRVFDLGYGWDRLMKDGWRGGLEFGAGAGEGPWFFVTGFLLWGRN